MRGSIGLDGLLGGFGTLGMMGHSGAPATESLNNLWLFMASLSALSSLILVSGQTHREPMVRVSTVTTVFSSLKDIN